MKSKKIKKIIEFFKKYVRFDNLDDIYTPEEKKELMKHWKSIEKIYKNSAKEKL